MWVCGDEVGLIFLFATIKVYLIMNGKQASSNTKGREKDFWNDLPDYVKAGIKRGQKQAAEGKLTPHDEVMKKYAKYL
jgi:hypothetical protein